MGRPLHPSGTGTRADRSGPSGGATRLSAGLVATIVLVGIAVALRVVATRSWPFWDLDVYIAGARALTAHADLYAVSAHGLLFTYPPFAAITFLPLAAAEGAAGGLLTVLSLMAFGVVGVVIARRLRLSMRTTLVVLAGALVLEPVTRTLVSGRSTSFSWRWWWRTCSSSHVAGEAYSSAWLQV